MLIAVTGSDEVNIIACIVAKSKGCKTIARISSADYIQEGMVAGKLEIFHADVAICPDMVTANQISKNTASIFCFFSSFLVPWCLRG